ncbi:MAG TPA: D-2-hydroxyacid dehydrogenase [Candidatus Udaeobacter sp.]|nr:D-2-hydroxyacid dehydrogenase [Candidatus Udaeobacter sp.]
MALRVLEYVRDPAGVWSLPAEQLERLKREFPDVTFLSPANREEMNSRLGEAEVVFGWAVRPDNFHLARRLRWIHVSAAGVASALFPTLIASDVVFTNGRGLHAEAMAEHTLGVMLAFARCLHLARDAQKERRWIQNEIMQQSRLGQIGGTTLGLVGFGHVGHAIATRARALGLHVITVRRRPASPPDPAHEQWGRERLLELAGRADWLVLAAASTHETEKLIGARELARMKPGAVLINLGRGALIDEPALIAALESGPLAGAGLDVTAEEPLPAESPLWNMTNVILTPHISGIGPRYWERAVDQFARNLHAYQRSEPLENVVDKRMGY